MEKTSLTNSNWPCSAKHVSIYIYIFLHTCHVGRRRKLKSDSFILDERQLGCPRLDVASCLMESTPYCDSKFRYQRRRQQQRQAFTEGRVSNCKQRTPTPLLLFSPPPLPLFPPFKKLAKVFIFKPSPVWLLRVWSTLVHFKISTPPRPGLMMNDPSIHTHTLHIYFK